MEGASRAASPAAQGRRRYHLKRCGKTPVSSVGWAKAPLRRAHHLPSTRAVEWWARHRTHSRPLALPTLRETPLRRRGGFLHAVEAEHLLGGGAAQALVGFPAGFEIGAVFLGQRRETDHGIGQAHALARRELAADLDARQRTLH